jgi:hypothetical protein
MGSAPGDWLGPCAMTAPGFDMAADGRFLVVSDSSLRGADELRVVLGWKR